MELEELKEEALKEYNKQGRTIKASANKLLGGQSYWLEGIATLLFILAILPPFSALLSMAGYRGATYLLPDGTVITSSMQTTLAMGNQTLQQVAQYISQSDITHNLMISGIISGILVGIGITLLFVDIFARRRLKGKFVEQYIYEHNKGKS